MSAAARLLHRHGRHTSLLLPRAFSAPSCVQNPNIFLRRCSPTWLPGTLVTNHSSNSFRSFSWSSWFHESGGGNEDRFVGSSELASDFLELMPDGYGAAEGVVAGGGEFTWLGNDVRSVASVLDGYHDFTGLPWWVIIGTSTLALRTSLLPILLLQLKKAGQIAVLYPKLIMPPPLPPPLSGISFREQFSLFQKKRKELGCPSFMWNFAYFIVQFPCFLLWMYSIRRMCMDCHPGFEHGGIFWFTNLTEYPNGVLAPIFPVLIAALHYTNVQVSFRTIQVEKMEGLFGLLVGYYKLYLDVLAFPLAIIGFFIPQGSLIYWATNSSLALLQQLTLLNPNVRKKLGLPELKVPEKHAASYPDIVSNKNPHPLELEISADCLSPEKLLDISLEELANGHQDRAFPLLQKAVEKDPDLARALVALGQILCSRNLLDEAAEHFERAISKIKEDNPGLLSLAYYGAGFTHIRQGRKSQGMEHLKKIATLEEPEKPMEKVCYYQGLVILASTLFNEGNKSEAAKYLRIAAAYDPAVNSYLKECEEEDDGGDASQKKPVDCS